MYPFITPEFARHLGIAWTVQSVPTPNINDKKYDEIQTIVLHHTVIDLDMAINTFLNPKKEVSANYIIGRENEEIFCCGPDSKKLWHAGKSQFGEFTNLNDYGPGIEIVNNGVDELYTNPQMASLVVLMHGLIKAYQINPFNILAHAEIAPNRKPDPSVHLDWEQLAHYGIGYFPKEMGDSNIILCTFSQEDNAVREMQSALYTWGYRYFTVNGKFDDETKHVVVAFKRRYAPDEYKKNNFAWTEHNKVVIDELLAARLSFKPDQSDIDILKRNIADSNPLREDLKIYEDQLIAMNLEFMVEEQRVDL